MPAAVGQVGLQPEPELFGVQLRDCLMQGMGTVSQSASAEQAQDAAVAGRLPRSQHWIATPQAIRQLGHQPIVRADVRASALGAVVVFCRQVVVVLGV